MSRSKMMKKWKTTFVVSAALMIVFRDIMAVNILLTAVYVFIVYGFMRRARHGKETGGLHSVRR